MHSLSMAESDCQASSFYSRLQGGQGVCLNFYISGSHTKYELLYPSPIALMVSVSLGTERRLD